MRLHHLEVENFRGIVNASISFGPHITILHGPNELGKSTLAEAIRAALLVSTGSKEGESYVTWGRSTPARVTLTFETGCKLWRVAKKFGKGSSAILEWSDDLSHPRFRLSIEGKGVEGRLRELLKWGIPSPGGKGPTAKPTSYLVTALLGRQGEAQNILDASLSQDKDETGKDLITQALGALDKDPVVAGVLERLTERVERVFTPTGKFKTSAESPLVTLQERLKAKHVELQRLQDDQSKGIAIQEQVMSLQDRREILLTALQQAETTTEAAKAQADRVKKKAELQAEIDDLRRQVADIDRLVADLASLREQMEANDIIRERLTVEEHTAAAALDATRRLLQEALENVARASEAASQSELLADAARQQRRAELQTRAVSLEAQLKSIGAAEKAVSDRRAVEQELAETEAAAALASAGVREAERALDQAEANAKLQDLVERQNSAKCLAEKYSDAQRSEQQALEGLRAAEAAVTQAESRRDRNHAGSDGGVPEIQRIVAELSLLRAVETHIQIKLLRDHVRELEAADSRAKECRRRAATRRANASQLEREIAARLLPNRERIASWRALETQIHSTVQEAAARSSLLAPVTVALAAALAAALVSHFVLDSSVTTAALVGILVALITGGLTWLGGRSGNRAVAEVEEQRRVNHERWKLEVEPSLRSCGLANLGAYESAVAEMERLRADAQRLRSEADRDDIDAAIAERAAASLEDRQEALTRREREERVMDGAAFLARVEEFAQDVSTLQHRIDEAQQSLETLGARLRQTADDDLRAAEGSRKQRQGDYNARCKEAESARTELDLTQRQCDPQGIERLRAQLEALGVVDGPELSIDDRASQCARAKHDEAATAERVRLLQDRLEAERPQWGALVSAIGESLPLARERIEAQLSDVDLELRGLVAGPGADPSSASKVLDDAKRKQSELEARVAADQLDLESRQAARHDADMGVANLKNDIASRQGELKALDPAALETRLQNASTDPVFQVIDNGGMDVTASLNELDRARQNLERCDSELNHAKGQLHLIAGHVGSERLAQKGESVAFAAEEVLERELTEKAAWRLLQEIQLVEAERTSHLGRSLGGPVADTFRALTGGRYGPIALDSDLKIQHVEADGAPREVSALSVGSREQLATLIRLAIAVQLKTALVLDDQLVHSDSERLVWFAKWLRSSACDHAHQVIVFTCRPGDYLTTETGALPVAEVNLAHCISR